MFGPEEIAAAVAQRARARRLDADLSQAGLALAAGVSLASVKRFERTGQVAFVALVRIALVLGATDELESWFTPTPARSIDEALARTQPRQRGRRH